MHRLIFIVIAIVYLAFPTKVYYWDAITFAKTIEDVPRLQPSLVHPNHLIYNFAGYLFYKLLTNLGFDITAMTALQILSSLLSTACAAVLFLILKETLRSVYLSTCMTLLFAFSATWWKFATDGNAYIPSVLFMLLCFYLVLPDRKPRPLLLAVIFFIAMAFHQLAIVMFPVLALGLYLQDGPVSFRRRALNVLVFAVIASLLIVTAYAYLFYMASGKSDIGSLLRWTVSFSPDADVRFDLWSNLLYSLRGHVRLFFGGRFNLLRGLINPFVIVLLVALTAAVAVLIFHVLRNVRRIVSLRWVREMHLGTRQKTVLLLSLLWTGLYLVFLFFWLPQNTFYRLFYLPALIILIGLTLASFTNRPAGKFTALFVAALALANFLFLMYPFSSVKSAANFSLAPHTTPKLQTANSHTSVSSSPRPATYPARHSSPTR